MKSIICLLLPFILVLISYTSEAQTIKNYETEWKKVEYWIQEKNLPKSALEEVKKIYDRAKNENQPAQIIKALVYTIALQQETREEQEAQAIKEVEREITTSKEPVTSILKSLQANLYWNYLQRHRWRLYDRTNTVNFAKEDIATWTIEDFHQKISSLYLESIRREDILRQTKLEPYDALIIKGNVRRLRPTLYDLLAHTALNYFKNDERDIKKPAYAFEITREEAFAPAEEFIRHRFPTKDSLSLQHKALLIYQQLLSFHLQDTNPDALIDADIDRLEFVYQASVLEQKGALYEAALKKITQKYGNRPVAAQAWYLLASYYEQLAAQYHPLKDTAYRYHRIKAKEILEQVIKDSMQKIEGWTRSFNLLQTIKHPHFSFEVEKVNLPERPFRSLVSYKNVSTLYFRIIKADEALLQLRNDHYDEKWWDALLRAAPLRQWQQPLPATNDAQQHAVEVKAEGLPLGSYLLLASNQPQFQKTKDALSAQYFHVSNISYLHRGDEIFVLHRETGQPLPQAQVRVYQSKYDYKAYRYQKVEKALLSTDKKGYVMIDRKKEEQNTGYYVDISYGGDRLRLNDVLSIPYYYGEGIHGQKSLTTFFFTDRSLYRPGQTVYFKGIVIENEERENRPLAGYKTKIYLQDANGEAVDSLTVTTNGYGSLSGTFILPQQTLKGSFSINEGNNYVYFSVEEYKRPKFYVELDKVQESYKVNDSVRITGTAKAYAGNHIQGASVVYRVVRQPRFIYPWRFRGWWPVVQPMEVAQGTVLTDDQGAFDFKFLAIPDARLDKKTNPLFDYKIYAEVTDINGETRTAESTVVAGYQSVLLQLNLPERIRTDSLKHLFIRTENLNGTFQPSLVTLRISRLIPENRLIRKRYWEQPDQFVMDKTEFIRYFPHDEYRDETDFRNWAKAETAWEKTDSVKATGLWPVTGMSLPPGFYVVEATTKDKNGQEVKDMRFMELFEANKNELNKPEYLWTGGEDPVGQPGEKVTLHIGSSAQNVFLIQQIDKGTGRNDIYQKTPGESAYAYFSLNAEKRNFDFPVTEKDRGGFGVITFFVKDNRLHQHHHTIQVPWTNKELTIEYATFRDQTKPGSEETWKIKIKGNKSEQAAAEMLASMYDASLDQFNLHQWRKPGIWPAYNLRPLWNNSNFSAVTAFQKQAGVLYKQGYKQYDYLNFNLYQDRTVRIRGRASGIEAKRSEELSKADNADSALPPSLEVEQQKFTPPQIVKDEEADEPIRRDEKNIQPRKNFNETAFFFPELRTNNEGVIEFSFTLPEALTRWKFQALTHTKDLALALSEKEIITQKELMVQPNMPRFLREGDRVELSTKIVNISAKEATGQAVLELLDAATLQPVDGWFHHTFSRQYFTVAAGQSEVVKFPVQVPYQFNKAVVWRLTAKAGSYSDGEEAVLPVLTNKLLVTETMPLPMRGYGTREFTFDKLLQAAESPTLQHQALTVTYTPNPTWYAVQALPYLAETPYECADMVWNRYYAHALAARIVHEVPRIKKVFEQWATADTSALLSNLQKDGAIKSLLLEETPWVVQAKTEEEQKKKIALFFEDERMRSEQKNSLEKLRQMQSSNGGFVWFKGGPDDRCMTQYILAGIGHLKKLGAIGESGKKGLYDIVTHAIPYVDKKIQEDYENLIKYKAALKEQQIGYFQIQYLYIRSFFPEHPLPAATQTAYQYYHRQAQQFWMKQNKYMQGMIALMLNRSGHSQTAKEILQSLQQTAITSEELGMYWKENSFGRGWFWWQAPIETQALLIEAFSEIGTNTKIVDDLKTWLLKNKQTNRWPTGKATAEACYALLLQGSNWWTNTPTVKIQLGAISIASTAEKTEAGTGYFKKNLPPSSIQPGMGKIRVAVQPSSGNPPVDTSMKAPGWGAVYWQYFEDLNKITAAATPLQVSKKLFLEKNSDRGPVLLPVSEGTNVHPGNKIKVRMELRVDRDMEYVHLKDMRAAALEPVNVLSGYKWQGRLGYYESIQDASAHFFFSYLPKGTYVFEYPLFVTHTGHFSNGITSIQCMYAPEFSAHSEGISLEVE